MTQQATNWKNVNNWHWVEKNCTPWAKEYLQNLLKNEAVEVAGTKVSVTDVSEVSGDVDLNQRKGKVITIYDVAVTMTWKGEDAEGRDAEGKILIPELMHDTELEEIVFEVTVDHENRDRERIKDVVRKSLTPVLRSKLKDFAKDLVEAHSKDVYIPPSEMTGHPVLQTYQPKPPAPAHASSASSKGTAGVLGGLTNVTQTVEFVASAADLYLTLLDKTRCKHWTRGQAEIVGEVGGAFSFFDGNVSGTFVELVPNEKIVQKWRLKTWPAGHYSTVTLTLDEARDSTKIRLEQKDVPIGERDATEKNWHMYFWNAIKTSFG
ncbi:activator of Hsp90 ATPase [Blyttiomyces helicus]|uniref:Activator of Hsp90 ATPase n=1 Tax=Blyttiomyces helicus TaxID=388810 RepID=A0A4P9WA14_9FUNG|nr:activator of Hsp90 ATPase [Blyttiomyces helicus]|eukprot:RKO89409.1 activator of Hsp90 ATPase [Blyttiomyces helicus]